MNVLRHRSRLLVGCTFYTVVSVLTLITDIAFDCQMVSHEEHSVILVGRCLYGRHGVLFCVM